MKSIIKGLLKQVILSIGLFLSTFFLLEINTYAASFAYEDFDWNLFYEENVDYWTDYCKNSAGEVSLEDCLEITLNGKKEYYKKLYKLLAKYERKGYKLNDNYILAVTFYYLTPDTFSEIPEEYLRDYKDGSAYNIDMAEDIESYNVDTDEPAEYYANETDTLKTLIKHMFMYPAYCYKEVGHVQEDDNGNKYCTYGERRGNSCVAKIHDYKLNYSEHLIAKWNWLGKLLGIEDKARKHCVEQLGGFYEYKNEKHIYYENYWRFLKESYHFDNKVHLNSKYLDVLEQTDYKLMKDMPDSVKEQYKSELEEIRGKMVDEIKSIMEDYGEFAETPDSYINTSTYDSAYWPVGSDEVTVEDGITYAKGNPTSTNISTGYGENMTSSSGAIVQSNGIDITDVVEGVTNVVAVKDGVVVYPMDGSSTNCESSSSESSCGGGYGNYIIIQHNDGTYSLYAYLAPNTISLKAGDSVKQGQVIGKAGSSGLATSPKLHFEIRQGTNSSSYAVDPLNYVSQDNTRPTSVSGSDFLTFLHSWENASGAPEKDGYYVVHDDGAHIPTVGYGVALKYNVGRFNAKGIDVSNYTFGDLIPKMIVDQVEMEEINEAFNNVRNTLANNGITLADYQVEALVSRYYNCGNINNFPNNYLKYGDTDALYQNYMSKPVTGEGVGYLEGLVRRRQAEWQLFHFHNYQLNA